MHSHILSAQQMTHLLRLTVVVEGVEVCGGSKTRVKVCCSNGRGHPLVICEKGQKGLPAGFRVVSVCPVCVHELNGLSEDVFALWVTVQVVDEAGHGVVEVIRLNTVFVVYDQLHELQTLTLVHSQHDIIIQKLT